MADKPKRRLRAPQTVRERVEASKEEKPAKKLKFGWVKRALAWPFKPFKKLGIFLSQYKIFRIIGKVFIFIGKIILPPFIRSSWHEIRLVTWPNWQESRRLTLAVLGFAVVFGALIASLDYGLSHLFKIIILGKN